MEFLTYNTVNIIVSCEKYIFYDGWALSLRKNKRKKYFNVFLYDDKNISENSNL